MTSGVMYEKNVSAKIVTNPEFSIPDVSPEEITVSSVSAIRGAVLSAGESLIKGQGMLTSVVKIGIKASAEIPFTAIDVIMSYQEEGIMQATITAISSTGVSIALGVAITATIPESTLTAGVVFGVGILCGVTNLALGKLFDGIYDFAEDEIAYAKFNEQTKELTIGTNTDNFEDLKTLTEPTILFGSVEENHYINNVIINQKVGDQTNTYHVKTGDTMWDIANRFGVTQEELIEANPWLSDRYSEDKSFALIRPDEQIVIPEGSIKGTDNSGMDKYLNDALNGNIHPDTIAPDGVTLPSSGQTQNPVVEHYTSKPQMLSPEQLLLLAIKSDNKEQMGRLVSQVPKDKLLPIFLAAINSPGITPDLLQAINNPLASSNPMNIPGFGKEDFGNTSGIGSLLSDVKNALNNMLNNFMGHFSHSTPDYQWIINPGNNPIYGPTIPPMAIDLDGEGIETIDINKSQIYFDVDNDGFREQTGWISKNEAILAIDKNENGKIDNQSEMFGSTDSTGFEDLKAIDSNGDGIINSQDADFNKIRLWQDLNENGVTEEGELKTLTEAGIQSIYTNAYTVNGTDNNNIITEKATVQYTDGTTKDLYDVATQYNDMYTVYGGDYILDADVIDLPWLRGYGNSMDLQLAASQNDNLKALVKQMASMTNANDIYNQFDNMMSMWLGENKTGEEMQKTGFIKVAQT